MSDLTQTRMSVADYLQQPETNQLQELIDGAFIVTPPPLDSHQSAAGAIFILLGKLDLGGVLRFAPVGLYVDGENFVEPDIFWIRPKSTDCMLDASGRYWRGAPDLIVEVLSPSTALRDRREKRAIYARIGVREYWLVDPAARYVDVLVYDPDTNALTQRGIYDTSQAFQSEVLGRQVAVQDCFGT